MGKVITHMTMSLDGYIADPDDQVGELFEWYEAGEVSVASANEDIAFKVDEASAEALRELTETAGALVAGRHLFDIADGWGDNHPIGAPVVVVTHRAPADAAERWPRTTFVDGVEAGDRQGAGDRRRQGRLDRQRQRHPAGTRPRPGGRGVRQPRTGVVRRGHPLLLQAGARTPAARGPDRGAGTPRPPPQVPGPSLTTGRRRAFRALCAPTHR